MDYVLLLQRIFDALFNSAIYSSLALALVIIFRSTGLLNFAQGEMATFTAYIAFVLLSGPQPRLTGGGLAGLIPGVPFSIPLAIAGAVICGMLVGAATERALIRPLGGASDLALVNITIGLLLATNSLMAQWWGTGPRFFPVHISYRCRSTFYDSGCPPSLLDCWGMGNTPVSTGVTGVVVAAHPRWTSL